MLFFYPLDFTFVCPTEIKEFSKRSNEFVHDLGAGRSVDEALPVLKALQTGELCPVDWQPRMETLGAT